MGLGKVGTRRAIRVDDAFGEKIANSVSAMLGHVGGEDVIESPIFTNDDDDMLNRAGAFHAIAWPVGLIIGIASRTVRAHRKCEDRCASRRAMPVFLCLR